MADKYSDSVKLYSKIVAKCWADDTFKKALIADPARTLKSEGVSLPDTVKKVDVAEDTPSRLTFVIPPKPTDISTETIHATASGAPQPDAVVPILLSMCCWRCK